MAPTIPNCDLFTMVCPSFQRLIFCGHGVLGFLRILDEGYINAISFGANAFSYDVPNLPFPILLMIPFFTIWLYHVVMWWCYMMPCDWWYIIISVRMCYRCFQFMLNYVMTYMPLITIFLMLVDGKYVLEALQGYLGSIVDDSPLSFLYLNTYSYFSLRV